MQNYWQWHEGVYAFVDDDNELPRATYSGLKRECCYDPEFHGREKLNLSPYQALLQAFKHQLVLVRVVREVPTR